jgi:hypothetical protein
MTSATPKPRAGEQWLNEVVVVTGETPRTDALFRTNNEWLEFARQLERELAAVTKDIKLWAANWEAMKVERDFLAAQLETCKAAHMSNCLDADKLRTRIAELREVLEHVCDTISGPAPALRRAREILAKHGR